MYRTITNLRSLKFTDDLWIIYVRGDRLPRFNPITRYLSICKPQTTNISGAPAIHLSEAPDLSNPSKIRFTARPNRVAEIDCIQTRMDTPLTNRKTAKCFHSIFPHSHPRQQRLAFPFGNIHYPAQNSGEIFTGARSENYFTTRTAYLTTRATGNRTNPAKCPFGVCSNRVLATPSLVSISSTNFIRVARESNYVYQPAVRTYGT